MPTRAIIKTIANNLAARHCEPKAKQSRFIARDKLRNLEVLYGQKRDCRVPRIKSGAKGKTLLAMTAKYIFTRLSGNVTRHSKL
jgi:hypothetical protein